MRPDVAEASRRLAMRKLADKYVGRHGEPPSLSSRRAAARAQDLNDDDRKHLKWCLDVIAIGLGSRNMKERADAVAALDFVGELLDRDYNLYPENR
jgi:hypothetical protein